MPSREDRHRQMLYPAVRIRTQKAGGSGTVVYSQPDPQRDGEHITFVLTNEHVVDDAIVNRESWDSMLQRNVKRDVLAEVTVETFTYHNLSHVVSANAHKGEIVAYSKDEDLAVLRLLSPARVEHAARLLPETMIDAIYMFDTCWTCGCSLLHDPFATSGHLTGLREVLAADGKAYLMQSSHIIFGNSGGATYLETDDGYFLVGVPARVTGIQLGFGIDILTWLGFSVHPSRLHQFIREQELQFLTDPTDDFHKAMARRAQKREQERRRLTVIEDKGMQESEA